MSVSVLAIYSQCYRVLHGARGLKAADARLRPRAFSRARGLKPFLVFPIRCQLEILSIFLSPSALSEGFCSFEPMIKLTLKIAKNNQTTPLFKQTLKGGVL